MTQPRTGGGLKADAVLLAITAFWGVTFVVVKDALTHADVYTFLSLRFFIGALAATAFAGRALLQRENLGPGLALGALLFLGFVTQTAGLALTTPSRSAFITGLCVLLVPIFSTVIFRRWPKVPTMVGIALAVGGLYFLTGGLTADGLAGQTATRTGDLLTLGCAVAFAFHILLTERWAPGRRPAALVGVQLWVTAAASTACWPFVSRHLDLNVELVSAVLVCGVFASAGAIVVQTWAQARTTAVHASLLFSLEPVFAALFSVLMGREVLGLAELLGGGLIVLGVLVSEAGALLMTRWRPRTSVG